MMQDAGALGEGPTRAERVRSRRARLERSVESVPHRKGRPRHRKQIPRRRYDLALPVETGAEVQLPAIPVLRSGMRILSALLLCVTLWGIWQVFRSPNYRVAQIEVQGAGLLSETQVRSLSRIGREPIFLIDPSQVEARLASFAEVKSADVHLRWPNGVTIELHERSPQVLWDDAGRKWWLSGEGVAFLDRGSMSDLVMVHSSQPVLHISEDPLEPAIDPGLIQAAIALCQEVCEGEGLLYDPLYGLGVQTSQGWTAYFGFDGDMHAKVRLYHEVVNALALRGTEISEISVAQTGAIFYRVAR